jgi:Protein of unknown function (DUF2569)
MSTKELKGVRGWLLIFCLTMTVRPLITFYTLTEQFPVFTSSADPKAIRILYVCLSIAIVCFGWYSAFLLWTTNSRAVSVAKVYLFATLFYWILLAVMPFLLSPDAQTTPLALFFRAMQKGLPASVVYFSVWMAYLCKSKRVANTYAPKPLHAQPA